LALSFHAFARADDAASLRERLDKATAESTLDNLTSRPWHAKVNVTMFDDKGKNPVDTTVEYWKSADESLRVITEGANTETLLHHDGHVYRSHSGDRIPSLAATAFQEILHPGPLPFDLEGSKPELRRQNFGKTPLDCIMLTQPLKGLTLVPLGLFPTFCLDHDADHLRATYDFGSRGITINGEGKFMDRIVATTLSVTDGATLVATAKVVALGTFTPTPETFQPAPELVAEGTGVARIAGGIVSGLKIGGTNPSYPISARENHVTGTVVLHAIIGRDGHIHTLRVVSTPDVDLATAALAAVRTWTYRPYLLNGEPVEVDTTVIVNFNLSG
jgi:TonB family protein